MDKEQIQVQAVAVKKICSNKDCKQELPADSNHFPKNKASRDGLGHWCKQCHAAYRTKKSEKTIQNKQGE